MLATDKQEMWRKLVEGHIIEMFSHSEVKHYNLSVARFLAPEVRDNSLLSTKPERAIDSS